MDIQFHGTQEGLTIAVCAMGVASVAEGEALVKRNHPMLKNVKVVGDAPPIPGGVKVPDAPKK